MTWKLLPTAFSSIKHLLHPLKITDLQPQTVHIRYILDCILNTHSCCIYKLYDTNDTLCGIERSEHHVKEMWTDLLSALWMVCKGLSPQMQEAVLQRASPPSYGWRWTDRRSPEVHCAGSSAACVCNLIQHNLHFIRPQTPHHQHGIKWKADILISQDTPPAPQEQNQLWLDGSDASLTCSEVLEGQNPLSRHLWAVILHHSHTQKSQILKVCLKLKVFVPHRVERVAVDGFGAEMTAVRQHPQHLHLYTGTAVWVPGTHVLSRHDLWAHHWMSVCARVWQCDVFCESTGVCVWLTVRE